jgi:protein TonB
MAYSYRPFNQRNDLLLWALVLSLAVHTVTLILLPGFSFSHVIKITEPLTVELQQLPPPPKSEPEQPKPPQPEKPKPEPPKLEKIAPKPIPPRLETPAAVTAPPAPIEAPPPPSAAVPPKTPSPQPAVIAVEQKASEPPPAFTAPTPPPATETSEDSLGEIRAAYGRLLRDEFSKHTKYPAVAALKGWEGKVRLRLQVDKEGNVIGTPEVVEGSGHKMLDDDAVKTILNISPLPIPPSQLLAKPIFVNTTIDYHKPR